MVVLNLSDSEQVLAEQIVEDNQFKCDMGRLNAFGKSRIRFIIHNILAKIKKENISEDVSACVFELACNAIKANYMYATILEIFHTKMPDKLNAVRDGKIFEDRVLAKTYNQLIRSEEVSSTVKQILRDEGKIVKINNKALKENRPLSEEETSEIARLQHFMEKTRNYEIKTTLRLALRENFLNVDIINDAPITDYGLERISSKRAAFRVYYNEDRVADFYMENLDESESAGFGSAMIDSRLLSWGMAPERCFQVTRINNKTSSSLTLSFI